jgi:hypothetical protein
MTGGLRLVVDGRVGGPVAEALSSDTKSLTPATSLA